MLHIDAFGVCALHRTLNSHTVCALTVTLTALSTNLMEALYIALASIPSNSLLTLGDIGDLEHAFG